LLYKRVIEQYENPENLKNFRSLIPRDIVLQTTKEEEGNIVHLLKWFKNDFMKWTPKDPGCEMCIKKSVGPHNIRDISDGSKSMAARVMQ